MTRRPDVRPTKVFIQSFKSLLHDTTVHQTNLEAFNKPWYKSGVHIAHTALDIPFTEVKVSVGRFTWKFTVH